MSPKAELVLTEALKLSPTDYAEVVDELLANPPTGLTPDFEAELDRRLADWDNPSKWVDGPTALEALRRR